MNKACLFGFKQEKEFYIDFEKKIHSDVYYLSKLRHWPSISDYFEDYYHSKYGKVRVTYKILKGCEVSNLDSRRNHVLISVSGKMADSNSFDELWGIYKIPPNSDPILERSPLGFKTPTFYERAINATVASILNTKSSDSFQFDTLKLERLGRFKLTLKYPKLHTKILYHDEETGFKTLQLIAPLSGLPSWEEHISGFQIFTEEEPKLPILSYAVPLEDIISRFNEKYTDMKIISN